MQLWTLTHSGPEHALSTARRAEAAGWHGMLVVDSQNLSPDSYVALALAASGTRRIGLGTGVTNSVTRHPAVTASAAAAVQMVSKGRMALGIGRGDSALAHLGRAPATVRSFERYLENLRRYLRGEAVPFDALSMDDAIAHPVADLELEDHPDDSRMRWVRPPYVPIEVAATGPRVIAAGARHGDRVMFTLGAVEERLEWGIGLAREINPEIAVGAYVNLVCHPDRAMARSLVRGGLTTFARFSVMHGDVSGPATSADRATLDALHDGYDMNQHTRADSSQAGLMTDDFIDRFAIAGPPDHCIERLRSLAGLGIDKVAISGPTAGTDRDEAIRAMALFDAEVLPAFC